MSDSHASSRASSPDSFRTARSEPSRSPSPQSPRACSDALSSASTTDAAPAPYELPDRQGRCCSEATARKLAKLVQAHGGHVDGRARIRAVAASGRGVSRITRSRARSELRHGAAMLLQAVWRGRVERLSMGIARRVRWMSFLNARSYVRLGMARCVDAEGGVRYACDLCGQTRYASGNAVRALACAHGLAITRCEPCTARRANPCPRSQRPPVTAGLALRVPRADRLSPLVPVASARAYTDMRPDSVDAPVIASLPNGDVCFSCTECGLLGAMGKQLGAAMRQRGRAPSRCRGCDHQARGVAWGNDPDLRVWRENLLRHVARHGGASIGLRVRLRSHVAIAALPTRRLARVWRTWRGLVGVASASARRRWRVLAAVVRLACAPRRPPRMRRPSVVPEAAPLRAAARTFVPQERYEHALLLLWERQESAQRQAVNWQVRAMQAERRLASVRRDEGVSCGRAAPIQPHRAFPLPAWPPPPSSRKTQ